MKVPVWRMASGVLALALLGTGCQSTVTAAKVDEAAVPTIAEPTPDGGPDDNGVADNELVVMLREFVDDAPGGVSVAVRREGAVSFSSSGKATSEGGALLPATRMRVGSISKPFIATMMLQLVDEGSVDLDATVATYLNDPIVGGDVTVRQLLGHRSGLANYTEQTGLMIRSFANPSAPISPQVVLESIADESHQPPGSFFNYSNTNYIIAGLIIEAVDETDLASALQLRIAEPLGLRKTSFEFGTPNEPVASGWSPMLFDGAPGAEYTSIASGAWAAGALVSSADDLLRFLDALRQGELVSGDSFALMTDVESGYGLGISAVALGPAGAGVGHNGSIPGYRSTMGISLTTGDAVIVLTNNDDLNAEILARRIIGGW